MGDKREVFFIVATQLINVEIVIISVSHHSGNYFGQEPPMHANIVG